MWLFTKYGFFSVVLDKDVKEPERGPWYNVSIRARVRDDLVQLLKLPTGLRSAQPEITELKGRDYPYRIYASREELSEVLLQLSQSLDYTNFKGMIHDQPGGDERATLYMRVWSVMNDAENKLKDLASKMRAELAQIPFPTDADAPRAINRNRRGTFRGGKS